MKKKQLEFLDFLEAQQGDGWSKKISSAQIIDWFNKLFNLLFPQSSYPKEELLHNWQRSSIEFPILLLQLDILKEDAEKITTDLYDTIPSIYQSLQTDANALLDSDPAAVSISEILNSYPGFFAIAVYRIANKIASLQVPTIPRILTEYAHSKTGIDIHPLAEIDVPFVIDHGTGIVIGETTIIGKNVHIYQGVTLGALWVEKEMEAKKRHPTVEHNVVIYANATILGGTTVIGNHSVIGGNTFITKSVNPNSIVQQSTKNNLTDKEDLKENILFNI